MSRVPRAMPEIKHCVVGTGDPFASLRGPSSLSSSSHPALSCSLAVRCWPLGPPPGSAEGELGLLTVTQDSQQVSLGFEGAGIIMTHTQICPGLNTRDNKGVAPTATLPQGGVL